MKKLFLFAILSAFVAGNTFAGGYKLNEDAIENAFSASVDVSFEEMAAPMMNLALSDEEPTKSGYLIRAFFCGVVGLHRSYMGTGGATLWWKYFCGYFVLIGGVAMCVDFWGVVFKGDEFLAKYKDNPKFLVWAGN